MSSYNALIHQYRQAFADADIPIATIRAYMFELCNDAGINLYTSLDKEVDPLIEKTFHEGIRRILEGEPMNYVLGYCWFYGYRFKVNKDVLIPRYETEELVLELLKIIDEKEKKPVIVDIGTGSGAIAIALKKEEPLLKVLASDISASAIRVAQDNAKALKADVEFLVGDMLKPLIARNIKVDILISNPPYIPSDEPMEHSVVDYEPHVALFGGHDGLKFYEQIIADAPKVLDPHGLMAFEIGYNQKEHLMEMFKKAFPQAEVRVLKDINGKNRMLFVDFA